MKVPQFDATTTADLVRNLVIPPRPEILDKLVALRSNPDMSLMDVADIISSDLGLSAAILKAANSPFFGSGRTLTSILQAVNLLGERNIVHLVHGLLLRLTLTSQNPPVIEQFWERTMHEASIAASLCEKLGRPADECQSFALFRSCGIAVMLMRYPNYERTLRLITQARDRQVSKIEQEFHGTSHDVVGYLVSRTWHMPENFGRAILLQHNPDLFQDSTDELLDHELKMMIAVARAAQHIWRTSTDQSGDPGWKDRAEELIAYLGMHEVEFEDWVDEMHDRIHAGL
jgi:HD-like signal output (HDOD) protein